MPTSSMRRFLARMPGRRRVDDVLTSRLCLFGMQLYANNHARLLR
jgi:hypothetical protein